MPYFAYDQNNSGGNCVHDDVVAQLVIIEAENRKQANKIADKKGLFDYDYCDCCGPRFNIYDGDYQCYATVDEAIADDFRTDEEMKSYPSVRIHYLDGTVRRLHDR
jgi:hypothetical protein